MTDGSLQPSPRRDADRPGTLDSRLPVVVSAPQLIAAVAHLTEELANLEHDAKRETYNHRVAMDGFMRRRLFGSMLSTALASGGGLSILFGSNTTLAGLMSLTAALLTTALTIINPAERSKQHKDAADKYSELNLDIGQIEDELTDLKIALTGCIDFTASVEKHQGDVDARFATAMQGVRDKEMRLTPLKRKRVEIEKAAPLIPMWVTEPYLVTALYHRVKSSVLHRLHVSATTATGEDWRALAPIRVAPESMRTSTP